MYSELIMRIWEKYGVIDSEAFEMVQTLEIHKEEKHGEICKHEYMFEPAREDLHKVLFTNLELSRTVARCRLCGHEVPHPLIKKKVKKR